MHRAAAQEAFDRWRLSYNHERPHEALALAAPSSRYVPSLRPYSLVVPEIEYGRSDVVRKVQYDGELSFANRLFRVNKAFRGGRVAIRWCEVGRCPGCLRTPVHDVPGLYALGGKGRRGITPFLPSVAWNLVIGVP